jgi:hypothetical protein
VLHFLRNKHGREFKEAIFNTTLTCGKIHITCEMGRDSSVDIPTRYGLDGPGIESRWGGEIFRDRPVRPWGSYGVLYNGYQVFLGGKATWARH